MNADVYVRALLIVLLFEWNLFLYQIFSIRLHCLFRDACGSALLCANKRGLV